LILGLLIFDLGGGSFFLFWIGVCVFLIQVEVFCFFVLDWSLCFSEFKVKYFSFRKLKKIS
jgi:membrane protein implicated in regulation of membrane protease activity